MVRKEILPLRDIRIDPLLEKVNNQEEQNKITFNITYHQVFLDVRRILEESYVFLNLTMGIRKYFLTFL